MWRVRGIYLVQSHLIATKYTLGVPYHLQHVYTKFETDISMILAKKKQGGGDRRVDEQTDRWRDGLGVPPYVSFIMAV